MSDMSQCLRVQLNGSQIVTSSERFIALQPQPVSNRLVQPSSLCSLAAISLHGSHERRRISLTTAATVPLPECFIIYHRPVAESRKQTSRRYSVVKATDLYPASLGSAPAGTCESLVETGINRVRPRLLPSASKVLPRYP